MSLTNIGPYRIVRKLGEGGMGMVFEAVHDAIERRVAIKVLHPDLASNREITTRLFNEARATNRIAHPSLVQIHDYGQLPNGTAYLVMELLKGESLTSRLHRLGGQMAPSQAVQIAWQVAAALTTAHDKGIIHRDLKPDNIMLVADPVAAGGERVKLLDFGIAKWVQPGQAQTVTNVIMGTPNYMSPEQCRGSGVVNAKSDVYALGVMLYEMLTGRLPFIGEGSGELIGMHLFQQPPSLLRFASFISPELAALVHRLLVKDKDQRPAMRQVMSELESFLTSVEGTSALVTDSNDPSSWSASIEEVPLSTLGMSAGQRPRKQPRHIWFMAAALLLSVVSAAALAKPYLAKPHRAKAAIGSHVTANRSAAPLSLAVNQSDPNTLIASASVAPPNRSALGRLPLETEQPAGSGRSATKRSGAKASRAVKLRPATAARATTNAVYSSGLDSKRKDIEYEP